MSFRVSEKNPGVIRKLEIGPAEGWSGIEGLENDSTYHAMSTEGKLQLRGETFTQYLGLFKSLTLRK